MSPRRVDPETRSKLVDIAAHLLAENGPQSLSARKVAAAAGSSTMTVYTNFGSMSGLIQAMVHEGFARLHKQLSTVDTTIDPVADMALLGRAYRYSALSSPHLYAVMFGGVSFNGFSLSEVDRQHGRYTLVRVIDCAKRCLTAGRFSRTDPELIAHQMWIGVHGLVTLELGDYFIPPYDADRCFEAKLAGLMVSAGDAPASAAHSITVSARRFTFQFGRRSPATVPPTATPSITTDHHPS